MGFKIRTAPSPTLVETFKTLGAQVASFPIGEVYTALQTHLIDGEETTLVSMEALKFYEVQKYLSATNHTCASAYIFCNGEAWSALPADVQAILDKHMLVYGKRLVSDQLSLEAVLPDKLQRLGLAFNVANYESFKAPLHDLYGKWRTAFGPTWWGLIESMSNT